MKFGFVGGAYSGRAKNADAERSINLFVEKAESPEAKAQLTLLGTPGLQSLRDLGGNSVRGLWQEPRSGRVFAVADSTFWEIAADGSATNRGTLSADTPGLETPVPMRSNGTQLVLCSNGFGYLFTLATNAFAEITVANFPNSGGFPNPVSQFEYLDTYLIALNQGTPQFYISANNDGSSWKGLDFASKEGWPDDIQAIMVDHRELWLFGSQRTEVWYDSGNPVFPIQPISGGVMETGIIAPSSIVRADNSIFWLGGDERGAGIAYRTNGYQAVRISNHAVEFRWSQYPTMTDCETFSLQIQGHVLVVFYFPSGDETWAYDCSTGLWHEWAFWDAETGTGYHAHLARNHVYAFGQHLVGARNSGKLYTQSLDLTTDDGAPIRRLRSCPVFQELKYVFYKQLVIYSLSGQANGVNGSNPLCYLRYSDDGGFTWSDYIEASIGAEGEYLWRTRFGSTGRSRDRVFEWTCSEPIPIAITDAYLEATKGSGF